MPSVQKLTNTAISKISSPSNASLGYMKQNARKFSLALTEALDKQATSGFAQKTAQKAAESNFSCQVQEAYRILSSAGGCKINKLF